MEERAVSNGEGGSLIAGFSLCPWHPAGNVAVNGREEAGLSESLPLQRVNSRRRRPEQFREHYL